MYDFHMHSSFSADCEAEMEEMIQEAINKGLKEIAFTEHLDVDYPDKEWDFSFDTEAYQKKLEELREKYQDRIQIRKGIEVGVQPHVLQETSDFIDRVKPEFIICSMHSANKQDLHSGEFFEDRTVDEAYRIYFEEYYECIKNFKNYHILGHLDLVSRYVSGGWEHVPQDIMEEILKLVISEGKGIELNTSGYKYGMNAPLPSKNLLRLYRKLGGEIITLGSDAHRPEEIAAYFGEAKEILTDCGFSYICSMNGDEVQYHSIK
ncbi:histidinol-phosphatase HisJ family protein [Oceanobacillus jeddahense]|uniref:Histidinol-phosphatase n=1 Tax=Oceanobacillus jeddahense TaxID=1462527 RepID=A0ABY5JY62_9BACI|nr:histidinol-phosphatase HisJ family protein [Oceanobacillus jeddahense]UUI04103.1 histidinol-phosphatase HisJ family protein [Oceanobacillus jeddahense]